MSKSGFSATVGGNVLGSEMPVIDPNDREAFNYRLRELVCRDAVMSFVAVDDTEGPVPPERAEDS